VVGWLETRKLQKVGYSTHSISLPSRWVKEWKLKQGDSIILTSWRDGSLNLVPEPVARNLDGVAGECIIDSDLCSEPGMLMRLVIGNYVLGRDNYRISSTRRISSGHIEEARATTRRLIGLSIIEECSDRIIIQCSIDSAKFNIQSLIRRLSIIALTMLDEAMQTFDTSDPSFAKDAISRENEVDMIFRLTLRLLMSAQEDRTIAERIGLEDPLHILGNVLVSKYLELVADQAESIARRVLEAGRFRNTLGEADTSVIMNLGKMASSIVTDAVDCFLSQDIQKANRVLETRALMDTEERRFTSGAMNVRAIAQGLAMISEKGAGIAEVAFDRALETPSKICHL
jgi:phosphate uptake regulator